MISTQSSARTKGGIFIKALFVLCVLFAAAALAWMMFLPMLIVKVINSRTGYGVEIEGFSANPFTSVVHVRGFKLLNPEGFPVRNFVDVKEFYADVEFSSLWSDRFVADKIVVNVNELALVKNRQGRSNAVVFKERLLGSTSETSTAPAQKPQKESPAKGFLIRRLELRFDKLLLVEGSSANVRSREVNVHMDQSYDNVTSTLQIATPIAAKVANLGVSLDDFAGKLGPQALDAARKAGNMLIDAGRKVGETVKGIFQSITEKTKK